MSVARVGRCDSAARRFIVLASSDLQGAILQLVGSHSAFFTCQSSSWVAVRLFDRSITLASTSVYSSLGAGPTHDQPHLPLTSPCFSSLVLPVAAALPLLFCSFCSFSSFLFPNLCLHSKSRTRCTRPLDGHVEEENSVTSGTPLHCKYMIILYFVNG